MVLTVRPSIFDQKGEKIFSPRRAVMFEVKPSRAIPPPVTVRRNESEVCSVHPITR